MADSPEGRLFVEIMRQALDDLASGQGQDAISAWRWFTQQRPMMRLCCQFLEVDPAAVSRAIQAQFASRVELIRQSPSPRYTGHRTVRVRVALDRRKTRAREVHEFCIA